MLGALLVVMTAFVMAMMTQCFRKFLVEICFEKLCRKTSETNANDLNCDTHHRHTVRSTFTYMTCKRS